MALFNCLECNKEISDKAQMCPSCGVAITSASDDKALKADYAINTQSPANAGHGFEAAQAQKPISVQQMVLGFIAALLLLLVALPILGFIAIVT